MPLPVLTRPVRVVVIDDTEDLRELLRMALTRGGLEVVGQASDGLEGIEIVQRETPDVVLLDLSMPVMDGLTALPRIRAVAPRAKIIILSGFEAGRMAEKALALGADGYLQKGMALGRILDYVRELVTDDQPEPEPAPPALAALPPLVEGRALDGESDAPVDLAPFGVLEVSDDPRLGILRANPEARRLLSDRAVVGTPLSAVAPELATSIAFNRLDSAPTYDVELLGEPVRATARRAPGRLLIYLTPVEHEVTLLRRAIATTAHEIRGPVTVLGGIAETLEQHGIDLDAAHRTRLLGSVARQARMLDSITYDLLTAAQVTHGTLQLHVASVDPVTVVESVIAHRPGVVMTCTDSRAVRADPLRLEQMLANLIGNAEKYGRAPISVTVRAHQRVPDLVCLDVVDSGDGVPLEFRKHLFEEFTRAGVTSVSGTGLGLFVVRTLAEAQGGTVEHHDPPGGGSAFTVSLPAAR